jgi:uncharacterized protein (TIGR02246 family)
VTTTTNAATSTVTGPKLGDQAAVAALPNLIMSAWAEHAAEDFANVFTQDGTMILPGVFVKGREQIRSFMENAFAGPYRGTRVTGKPFSVKLFGTGSALLHTEGGVLAPGEEEVAGDRAVRASWLAVKEHDGRWRLAAYQNTPRDAG